MQVRIGEETFDLQETEPGTWSVNGTATSVAASPVGPQSWHLVIEGRSHVVTLERRDDGYFRATVEGHVIEGVVKDARALLLERYGITNGVETAERTVRAPMPGMVVRVLVAAGEAVEAGQEVVVLEAMKMENVLRAPAAGTVGVVHAGAGKAVVKNELLLEID